MSTRRKRQRADEHESLDAFLSFFSCNVCQDISKQMSITPCGHIFCEECVASLCDAIRCPCCNKRFEFIDLQPCGSWTHAMNSMPEMFIDCERCGTQILRANREQHSYICLDEVIGCKHCGRSFSRKFQRSHRCEQVLQSKLTSAVGELSDIQQQYDDVCDEREHLKRQLEEYEAEYANRAPILSDQERRLIMTSEQERRRNFIINRVVQNINERNQQHQRPNTPEP